MKIKIIILQKVLDLKKVSFFIFFRLETTMKNTYIKKALWYGIFFVLSLYVIFFVWKSFNEEAKKTETNWFTVTGSQDFKLWMDIAWWVKLTYKLNFGDYKQIYTEQAQFNEVKADIINIISKKIDERISKLWVSDYKVYNRAYDEKDYLIVEIWWVSNLDEAKNIIGNTITLHFKVPADNEDSSTITQRETKVQELYNQVKTTPNQIKTIADNSELVDTYYNKYNQVSEVELPMIYDNIKSKLQTAKTWTIFQLQDWLYHMSMNQDWVDEINWWTIIKLNNREIQKSEIITPQSVTRVADDNKLTYTREYEFDNYNINKWDINFQDWTLIYNGWEFFTWEESYKLTLYQIAKPDLLWKQWEELKTLQDKHDKLIKESIDAITNWEQLSNDIIQVVNKQRVSQSNLSQYIPGFTAQNGISKIDSIDATYISNIFTKKATDQKLYIITKIRNVNNNQVDNLKSEMKTETLYTIEEIFIKTMPTWQSAIDPITQQILDAKFFQYASVWASPTWQPVVQLHFNSAWEEVFCHISEEYIWESLAIFIWDKPEPVTVATIRSKICWSSPYIEWNFTAQETKDMVQELNDWAFPVKMDLESQEKVSAILWSKALFGALYAWGLWIVLIWVFLFFMYGRRKALVWFWVLVIYAVYLLAILKLPLVDYAFSLSGIAAIVLALGMAVDANILIFERVREELKSWKKLQSAIDIAVQRSRSPILDGNLSTWLIAIVLAWVGMSIFRWFGTMILVTMSLVLVINVKLTKTLLHLVFKNKSDYNKK